MLFVILGSVLLGLGAVCFLLAAFFRHVYYNLKDGSSSQYQRLEKRMTLFLVCGIVLASAGIISMVLFFIM